MERKTFKYMGGDISTSPAGQAVRIDEISGQPKEVTWKNRVVITEGAKRFTISKNCIKKIIQLGTTCTEFTSFVEDLEDE